jgi:hypothetical protein
MAGDGRGAGMIRYGVPPLTLSRLEGERRDGGGKKKIVLKAKKGGKGGRALTKKLS